MEEAAGNSVKYQAKFSRVLIKREIQQKTAGGIILPGDTAKRHAACEGVIVGLGETAGFTDAYYQDETGEWQIKTTRTFKEGDKVLFGRHAGAWLDATHGVKGDNDDGTLFICQDQDILAVINEQGIYERRTSNRSIGITG